MDAVVSLLPDLGLPTSIEFRVEPARDYPGQQLAIDLHAPTDDEPIEAVETVRDGLFHRFRIVTRTSAELDREVLLNQTA
jgi:hypothetical protein